MQGVVKNGVSSFKGIPFAAPPVGDLRWKAPHPVKPWTGLSQADAFGPGPMQNAFFAAIDGRLHQSRRGLSLSQRVDRRKETGRKTPGHGLDLRRCFH